METRSRLLFYKELEPLLSRKGDLLPCSSIMLYDAPSRGCFLSLCYQHEAKFKINTRRFFFFSENTCHPLSVRSEWSHGVHTLYILIKNTWKSPCSKVLLPFLQHSIYDTYLEFPVSLLIFPLTSLSCLSPLIDTNIACTSSSMLIFFSHLGILNIPKLPFSYM